MIEAAARAGRAPPDKILNRPELIEGLALFYVAFADLTTDRSVGMAEGPIPWSSIVRYAGIYGFDDDLREDLLYLVRAMDRAYLKYRRDEAKTK